MALVTIFDDTFQNCLEKDLLDNFKRRLNALAEQMKKDAYKQLENEIEQWVSQAALNIMKTVSFERSGIDLVIKVAIKDLKTD